MKAYVASCQVEALLVGDNLEDAISKADDALVDSLWNASPSGIEVREAETLPFGWRPDHLVYGTDEDMTAEEALRLNQ